MAVRYAFEKNLNISPYEFERFLPVRSNVENRICLEYVTVEYILVHMILRYNGEKIARD